MACLNRCSTCNKYVKASSIEFDEASNILEVTLPDTAVSNRTCLCVDLSEGLPAYTGNPFVVITVNGNTSPIINSTYNCSLGTPNYMYANQLKDDNCCSVVFKRHLLIRYASDSSLWGYVGRNTVRNTL